MSSRDWERELAEIDRKLSAIPDETPPASDARSVAKVPATGRGAGVAPASSPAAPARANPAAGASAAVGPRTWKTTAGLLARVLLTGLLLAAVVVWPYETRCGTWLAAYLGAIAVTGLGGVWTAIAAWRHRAPLVHLVGLLLLLAAGVAAGLEVLPRVGYAMPDPAHPAIWACQ